MVNHRPEPISNIILSLFEDGLAVVGTWLAVTHPVVTLVIVLIFLAFFAWFSPKIFRLLRIELIAVLSLVKDLWSSKRAYMPRATHGSTLPMGTGSELRNGSKKGALVHSMPKKHTDVLAK